ncbi:transaldolase [Ktedonobacter racemifer]|uniref:transaldolase n=1 Tax=Ktedonobacter racemifer TaxID=363277 RepID=UPI00031D7CC8|nr:transaldolase [Ktedonobacter racemifer]
MRLINEDGITGATGNPTIFEQPISKDTAYDEQMQQLLGEGKNAQEVYEALALTDVMKAAQILRFIYEQTDGRDGYVSIEVSPLLAYDTAGTLAETRRLWKALNSPNVMIKIPATPAGIPAIHQALVEGININITLIFSIENYRQVVEAYLSALEERRTKGQDIKRIASVASFFVSRVDVLVDQLIEDKIKTISLHAEQQKLRGLQGKIAIANARLIYQEFKRLFANRRFEVLKHLGAEKQRPLWASTSTKNPAYRDVLYAEELIGPDTIDTMPLKTIENFRDHGRVRYSLEDALPEAKAALAALEEEGIHYDQVTQQLQEEGVQRFADSFCALLASIDHKRKVLRTR